MLGFSPKLLLAATAFAPVLFTSALVSIFIDQKYWEGAGLIALVLVCWRVCVLVLQKAKLKLSPKRVLLKSVKPADKELVGFVLAYLLPLARGSVFDPVSLAIAMFVFFVVVMTSNAYHTNPLMGLIGYHFYEVVLEDVGYVLVSRQTLHNKSSINQVVQITDYMLLDTTIFDNTASP